MKFVQTIEVEGADESALQQHLTSWHADQRGVAPGYEGARILADQEMPGRCVIEVVFSSQADAEANNARPETAAWAEKLGELASGAPQFRSFRLVYETAAD